MKKFAAAAVLALGLTTTGCIGSNNAFNNLTNWNRQLSDNKWVNELVFFGLNLIPVYGVFYFADIIIFNSVEFWTGDNPIEPNK